MSASSILRELAALGAGLRADGDQLLVDAPKGAITAELASRIREHKQALLEAVRELATESVARIESSEANTGVLSLAQDRIYALDRMNPKAAAFNLAGLWALSGRLDEEAFTSAFRQLLERHPLLRARFFESPAGVKLETSMPQRLPLSFVSFEGTTQAEIVAWADETTARPRDLSEGVFQLYVLRQTDEEVLLCVAVHGIIWDAWCYDIMLRDLGELYVAQREGRAPELPQLSLRYEDFAVWQRNTQESKALVFQREQTLRRLYGALERVPMPTDFPLDESNDHQGARLNFRFPPELAKKVREEARARGVTPNMLVLAGFASVAARLADVDHVLITTPVRNRDQPGLEDIIGPFTNSLFLAFDFRGEPGFGEVVSRVRTVVADAVSNQGVLFDKLLESLEVTTGTSSLFQLDFSYQDTGERVRKWGDLQVNPGPPHDFHTTHSELSCWVLSHKDGGLSGAVDFRTALYRAETVRYFLDQFERLLELGLAKPEVPVRGLELDSPPEVLVGPEREPTRSDSDALGAQVSDWLSAVDDGRAALIVEGQSIGAGALRGRVRDAVERPSSPERRLEDASRTIGDDAVASVTGLLAAIATGDGGPFDDCPVNVDSLALSRWAFEGLPAGGTLFLPPDGGALWWTAVVGGLLNGHTVFVPGAAEREDEFGLAEAIERASDPLVVASLPLVLALESSLEAGDPPRYFLPAEALTFETLAMLSRRGVRVEALTLLPETGAPAARWSTDDEGRLYLAGVAPGLALRLVDRRGNVVPEGAVGMLEFHGKGKAFVSSAKARLGPGGLVEYRGAEIDSPFGLEKVERALMEHPTVGEAAVAVFQDEEETRLIGYVTAGDGASVLGSELRAYLRERFPGYMVPGLIMELRDIPRTPNGQVDRKLLPDPIEAAARREFVPPSTELEQCLAHVWQQLLGIDRLSIHDNFFELGGNSLLAIQAVAMMNKETGARVEPRLFFFQSLGQLASSLEHRTTALATSEAGTRPS